jgi:hypothetical protein
MEDIQFERAIVELLVEIIEGRDLKHDAVAKAAWPDRGAAGRTWQAIRNDDPPQKLTLRDAYGLAKELNLSMCALCGIVEGRVVESVLKQQIFAKSQKKEEQENQEPWHRPTYTGDERQSETESG